MDFQSAKTHSMKLTAMRPGKKTKRLFVGLVTSIVIGCFFLAFNAARMKSRQIKVLPAKQADINEATALAHFASAVQLPTVSYSNRAKNNVIAFLDFQSLLDSAYPAVTENLIRHTGEDFGDPQNTSLLYRWSADGNNDMPAVLLMAHYDVVPIEQATLKSWKHPPFSGVIKDGYLWGRGTLDDKAAAIALMEACERLVNAGFQPQRDVYLALGHDEEVGGKYGNQQIAQWMRNKGIRLSMVLDEGGGIYRGVPGLERPAALIGIAEKGFLNITMKVQLDEAGHASIPPGENAIGILASAISKLQHTPFPAKLDGGISRMLDYLGPEMSFLNRIAIGNRRLFGPVIEHQFSSTPAGNAALRTTLVPTIIEGGFTENALPSTAAANLHLRIQPGESVESSLRFIRSAIQDERITLQIDGMLDGSQKDQVAYREPSRVSSDTSDSFEALHRTIKQVYPNVAVAPFYVVASTDSAHYDDPALSKDVYRFTPWNLDQSGLNLIHGVNEKIATAEFIEMIRFYEQLLMNLAGNNGN
ncbi:M20/M25/M40 family metallo-hydrolase [bacterium]|nr:M20/M25/M40 family metallo-hydrolase [bacterium]